MKLNCVCDNPSHPHVIRWKRKKNSRRDLTSKISRKKSGYEILLTEQFPKCSCVSNVNILKILLGDISLAQQNPKLENKVSSKSRY